MWTDGRQLDGWTDGHRRTVSDHNSSLGTLSSSGLKTYKSSKTGSSRHRITSILYMGNKWTDGQKADSCIPRTKKKKLRGVSIKVIQLE